MILTKNVLFAIFLIAMYFPLGCKKPQVTDKDGNVYKTVSIGDQEWTAENLNEGGQYLLNSLNFNFINYIIKT